MKIQLTLIITAMLVLVSCRENSPAGGPDYLLSYDGPNETAPILNGGTYQAAVRFPSSFTQQYSGRTLTEVAFYIYDVPQTGEVRIYGAGTPDSPGSLLYSESITRDLKKDQWNYHQLTETVELDGNDLWITFRFGHNYPAQTIGCDPGPSVPDGDWIFSSADNMWQTYQQRSGASINWNIRGAIR